MSKLSKKQFLIVYGIVDQNKIDEMNNYCIAAASIVAKVTRDRIMRQWDEVYPMYGFAKHKGYGTAEHIRTIKENGPCMLHRKTFIKNFV